MLTPLVTTMEFEVPIKLAFIVMALGDGAMTVSHANNSYF